MAANPDYSRGSFDAWLRYPAQWDTPQALIKTLSVLIMRPFGWIIHCVVNNPG